MAVTDQHYVRQPAWLFWLRIAQTIFAVLILALTAFSMSTLTNILGSFGYNIFCCVYTFITLTYLCAGPVFFLALWNMWAALVLEIFAVVFWLSGWASLAAWAALGNYVYDVADSYSYGIDDDYYGIDDHYRDLYKKQRTAWQCAAAAAGLGALLWVSFIVSLVVYSVHLHRHRRAPENANLPKSGEPVYLGHGGMTNEMKPVDTYGGQHV